MSPSKGTGAHNFLTTSIKITTISVCLFLFAYHAHPSRVPFDSSSFSEIVLFFNRLLFLTYHTDNALAVTLYCAIPTFKDLEKEGF